MNKEKVDQMITITDKIKIDKTEAGREKVDKMITRKEIEILQIIVKLLRLKQLIHNIQDNQFLTCRPINQIFYHQIQQSIFHLIK
jgi:hypothetical protein